MFIVVLKNEAEYLSESVSTIFGARMLVLGLDVFGHSEV